MPIRACLVLLLLAHASHALADDFRHLTGTVVDTRGKPAANVEVSYSWTANGTQHAPDGTAYNLDTVQGQRAFWGHVGQMEPRRRRGATTGSDGRFALDVDNRFCVILALDSAPSEVQWPSFRTASVRKRARFERPRFERAQSGKSGNQAHPAGPCLGHGARSEKGREAGLDLRRRLDSVRRDAASGRNPARGMSILRRQFFRFVASRAVCLRGPQRRR